MNWDRLLLWLVRLNAAILLLAAPCAFLPVSAMEGIHRDWLKMGSFPDVPLSRYMARSLSLVYAMHGVFVLAVTSEWPRYRSLVPLLARIHIGFGIAMVMQDWISGMPWWWTALEGPTIIVYGLIVWIVVQRVRATEWKVPRES